jgi:alanyl-tRNA synthetase
VPERVNDIVVRLREAERQLEKLRADAVLAGAGALVDSATDVAGVALVTAKAPDGTGAKDVRTLAIDVRGRFGDRAAVVVVAAATEGKVPLVVATTAGARGRGLSARALFDIAAPGIIGGGGGGRDDLAQGSGAHADALGQAFAAIEAAVADAGRGR